jgi:putative component of toxin-antitoxin plasmid stabilization module
MATRKALDSRYGDRVDLMRFGQYGDLSPCGDAWILLRIIHSFFLFV